MNERDAAAVALERFAAFVAEKHGPDLVLAALRGLLAPHLTPEAVERANANADLLERLKFGQK